MSRYITVGFDTDAAAERFKALVKKMGHLLKLGETYQNGVGETKLRIHNIQARGVFNTYVPTSTQRLHDYASVIVEFKDPTDAQVFAIAAMSFSQGNIPTADISDHITALIATLRDDKVAGVRLEKE